MITREQILTNGDSVIRKALADLSRITSMTHAEYVAERIRGVLALIEIHRSNCTLASEHLGIDIGNDDIVEVLRLRLRLLEQLAEWET